MMVCPEAKGNRAKSPSSMCRIFPYGGPLGCQATQIIVVMYGFPPELDGKTVLLKVSHTFITEHKAN